MSTNQIQKVNTSKTATEDQMNFSMDGAAIQYSLISDVGVEDRKEIPTQSIQNRSRFNFTSRSFSNTNSPLRHPTDALGVIAEPKDIALLQDSEFLKSFRNLESSVNYQPSTLCLVIET